MLTLQDELLRNCQPFAATNLVEKKFIQFCATEIKFKHTWHSETYRKLWLLSVPSTVVCWCKLAVTHWFHCFFFFMFFFSFFFLLKDNCFTEFCCFLSNLNTNQPLVHIYPLPFEPPSHHPPNPTPLDWYRALVWVSWAVHQIPIGYLLTYGSVSFRVTLSIHLTLSSPLPVSISGFIVF